MIQISEILNIKAAYQSIKIMVHIYYLNIRLSNKIYITLIPKNILWNRGFIFYCNHDGTILKGGFSSTLIKGLATFVASIKAVQNSSKASSRVLRTRSLRVYEILDDFVLYRSVLDHITSNIKKRPNIIKCLLNRINVTL